MPGRETEQLVQLKNHLSAVYHEDRWILEPGRTWDEINTVIEGKLQAIEANFQFSKEPTPYAQIYGLEKPPRPLVRRTLAFVELLDEQHVTRDRQGMIVYNLQQSLQQQRKAIDDTVKHSYTKNQRDSDKRIAEDQIRPFIDANNNQAEVARKVEDVILRKAVLEIFSIKDPDGNSQQPYIFQNLPKLVAETKSIIEDGQDPRHENFKSRKPVDYFLTRLAEYLSQTRDLDLFRRYAYRQSPQMIQTMNDSRVLDASFDILSDPRQASQITPEKKVVNSFFNFLKNRAAFLSAGLEQTPYCSLLHDIYVSAFKSGGRMLLDQVNSGIDSLFSDRTELIRQEMDGILKRYADQSGQVNAYILSLSSEERESLLNNKANIVDKLPSYVMDFFTDKDFLLLAGFVCTQLFEGPSLGSKILVQISKQISDKMAKINPASQECDIITDFAAKLPREQLLKNKNIDLSLWLFSDTRFNFKRPLESEEDLDLLIKLITEESGRLLKELDQKEPAEYSEEDAYRTYLASVWFAEVGENSDEMERENRFLWNEVLDEQMWFIAPVGDRYSAKYNPDLAQHSIDSITFNMDPTHPREYEVRLKIANTNIILDFWLDTQRNLLGSNRQYLHADPLSRDALLNLILRRLYFITSGGLREAGSKPRGDEGVGIQHQTRRSHYMILSDTQFRTITMESRTAKLHAEEILKEYGIDIYREIARRRQRGTLAPNEYLTFSRAVWPPRESGYPPNEIAYDPEYFQMPEAA